MFSLEVAGFSEFLFGDYWFRCSCLVIWELLDPLFLSGVLTAVLYKGRKCLGVWGGGSVVITRRLDTETMGIHMI